MIKTRYFMPLFAALALTSCSQNDAPSQPGTEGKDLGYVAVNIVQPAGTRATDNFADGSTDENFAETGVFYVFKQDGSINGTPQTIALTPTDGTTDTPAVEKVYNAVLVINGATTEPTVTDSYQIVCVLNAPDGLGTVANISELKGKIADYSAHTKGTFIMTNSVYDKTKYTDNKFGAEVASTNIKQSAAEALNNPVEIYVERVVARLDVAVKDGGLTNESGATKPTIDGKETPLDIVITGYEVANIAKTAHLFKNVSNVADDTWYWDASNFRSYWETTSNLTTPTFPYTDALAGGYKNQSYTQIANDEDFNINNFTFDKEYLLPNTVKDHETSVLVTAKLCKQNTTTGLDIVYLKGGYFSPNEALKLIATEIANKGYWKKTDDNHYETLAPSYFEWKNRADLGADKATNLKDYEVVACVKSTVNDLYQKTDEGYSQVDADKVNAELLNIPARYYKDGMCYYYVNIDQTPALKDNGYSDIKKVEGVVRNHVYKLTLNSIAGLGTPVFDPNDVIIPQTPPDEELWYLAARVKVLKWKVVKQEVDFNGIK